MNGKRHLYALAAALMAFGILTMMSGAFGMPELVVAGVLMAVCTVLFFHYRRKSALRALTPATPARDDRVIPRDVRTFVIARDGGKCQLRYPGICLVDKQIDIDHVVPWSRGGSSKDAKNLQCACHPCNARKGAKMPSELVF